MKTELPEESEPHREAIETIRDTIVKHYRDKVHFIILYGSFARGDWVYDRYAEGRFIFEYASDYDIVVVIGREHKNSREYLRMAGSIERWIHQVGKGLFRRHRPHVIVERLKTMNKALGLGRYFYVDIKREGILLYDSGKHDLAEPRELTSDEVLELAKMDYDHWFPRGVEFQEVADFLVQRGSFNLAAFNLHQATECLLNCALLVMTGYKPKTHDLAELVSFCASNDTEFLKIFPRIDGEVDPRFELLREAYIGARYDSDYRISEDGLAYLAVRVKQLQALVQVVYDARVNELTSR